MENMKIVNECFKLEVLLRLGMLKNFDKYF